jgi:hypothetical protein
MSLQVAGADSAPTTNLAAVAAAAVQPFGFRRQEEPVLPELTIYSLRTDSPKDLINVIIDHQTSKITLVEYLNNRSRLDTQVAKALEEQVSATYAVDARFKDLPCPWLGP